MTLLSQAEIAKIKTSPMKEEDQEVVFNGIPLGSFSLGEERGKELWALIHTYEKRQQQHQLERMNDEQRQNEEELYEMVTSMIM